MRESSFFSLDLCAYWFEVENFLPIICFSKDIQTLFFTKIFNRVHSFVPIWQSSVLMLFFSVPTCNFCISGWTSVQETEDCCEFF